MRSLILGSVLAVALVVTGAAIGVGPWPGLAATVSASSGDVRYTAARAHGSTVLKAIHGGSVVASRTFKGAYGIPAVTSDGLAGGLSPDGRLLVLAQPPNYQGLRAESRFLLVSTGSVSSLGTIVLRGEFGYDAVSPDRRTLYLIQHVSARNLVRYAVRAYDLQSKRLLPGAVVDKRHPSEAMQGYPIARSTSADGSWVYTLYTREPSGRKTFVHALNAAARTAACIDLPGDWPAGEDIWRTRLDLDGGRLIVRHGRTTIARIDTTTLKVL